MSQFGFPVNFFISSLKWIIDSVKQDWRTNIFNKRRRKKFDFYVICVLKDLKRWRVFIRCGTFYWNAGNELQTSTEGITLLIFTSPVYDRIRNFCFGNTSCRGERVCQIQREEQKTVRYLFIICSAVAKIADSRKIHLNDEKLFTFSPTPPPPAMSLGYNDFVFSHIFPPLPHAVPSCDDTYDFCTI